MSVVAERVASRRRELQLTQEDLAAQIGTSQRQVSKYETGRNDPTGDVIAALASALETTADWLLGITQSPDRRMHSQSDLSEDERELIEVYRSKPREKRRQAIDLLRVL